MKFSRTFGALTALGAGLSGSSIIDFNTDYVSKNIFDKYVPSSNTAFQKGKKNKSLKIRSNRLKSKSKAKRKKV